MQNRTLHITALSSGGIITNYFRTSSCRHCLYRCGPTWPKDYISRNTAEKNFQVIRELRCSSVHIGGGEHFLRPVSLAETLRAANSLGVTVEYVETNSSWFRDLNRTCRLLEKLAGLGLTTLLVSISPFHNEYIPFARVRGVMEACRLTGISVFPWTANFIDDLEGLDENRRHSLAELCERFGENYVEELPDRYWISPGGRALETFDRTGSRKSLEELLDGNDGCVELGETSHFHLDLFGNYIPGLCAGLSIRREDLGAPLSEKEYPLLSRLWTEGIGALFNYAVETYGFRPAKAYYWTKCELCFEIRRFLAIDKGIGSPELQPSGHYLYG